MILWAFLWCPWPLWQSFLSHFLRISSTPANVWLWISSSFINSFNQLLDEDSDDYARLLASRVAKYTLLFHLCFFFLFTLCFIYFFQLFVFFCIYKVIYSFPLSVPLLSPEPKYLSLAANFWIYICWVDVCCLGFWFFSVLLAWVSCSSSDQWVFRSSGFSFSGVLMEWVTSEILGPVVVSGRWYDLWVCKYSHTLWWNRGVWVLSTGLTFVVQEL